MKLTTFLWLLPTLCMAVQGQNASLIEETDPDPTATAIGPDHRRVEEVVALQDEAGRWRTKTNSFVQIELGLNYRDKNGEWQPTEETFVEERGWATVRRGPHYVALYNNLNAAGSVLLEQPDGKSFRSTVLGLAYTDAATGESVLIAELQDCQGVLWTDNQVIYPNAFSGVSADVRYSYHKWGFEQDIILREEPPSPEQFGLNPETTRLEVWTEFYEGSDPVREQALINSAAVERFGAPPLVDESLDFGAMRIGLGRAFKLGDEGDTLSFVAKQWTALPNGRRFLVETVEMDSIAESLDALPANGGGASLRKRLPNRLQAMQQLRVREPARAEGNGKKWKRAEAGTLIAQIQRPGVVVDYSTINYTTNSMTFRGDQTYYVSGLVTCNGTTTFEGGAVIKYTNTASARIEIGGTTVWPTDNLYRPIIFTAKDDNTVGETIPGSTGSPSGYYADSALKWANATNGAVDARNLRFVRAKAGISINGGSAHKFRHVQFVDCESGIKPTSTDFGLHNSLFTGVTYIFNGSSSTARVEHTTVNGATAFNYNSTFAAGNLRVTNSIVAAVTTLGSLTATNKVAFLSSASGVFATQVAGGAHYLASGSVYRDLGTSVSSELSSELPKMTTYAPTLINSTITSAAEFSPANSRDSGALDLGYHYAPIDFLFSTASGVIVTNAAMSFKNGVVISHDSLAAFVLTGTSSLTSVGLPQALNVFTYYTTVQEKKSANHGNGSKYAFYSIGAYNSGTRTLSVALTDFEGATVPDYYCLYSDDGYVAQSMAYRDCQFTFADAFLISTITNSLPVTMVNNLWLRPTYFVFGSFPHLFANQTVSEGSFDLSQSAIDWRDSLLLSTTIAIDSGTSGNVTNRNCLFVGVTTNFTSNGTKVSCLTNATFTFATSTLGPWYQSTTSGVNQGSRTASLASLYHHTVVSAQTKETNSTVDIGFHYVALSGGVPVDTDADGMPDYLEDANGNGSLDSGETSPSSATDLGFNVLITSPKNNSVIP